MSTEKFSKLYISLKFRLHGMGMFRALHALEYGRMIHSGMRKDGVTPEYQHQLEIALFILTLKDVDELEDTIICALLHDGPEDYPHVFDGNNIIYEYGDVVWRTICLLDKNRAEDEKQYFSKLSNDMLGSIVKLVDRINNFQSMRRGNFTIEKQIRYRDEVVNYFLPMAKTARKKFPRQMDSYYNIETVLKYQLEFVNTIIEIENERV